MNYTHNLEPGTFVKVWWMDITGHINEPFKRIKPAVTWTIGRVYKIKKRQGMKYVVIVTSGYEDKSGDCTAIPLGCIYKVETIKE